MFRDKYFNSPLRLPSRLQLLRPFYPEIVELPQGSQKQLLPTSPLEELRDTNGLSSQLTFSNIHLSHQMFRLGRREEISPGAGVNLTLLILHPSSSVLIQLFSTALTLTHSPVVE